MFIDILVVVVFICVICALIALYKKNSYLEKVMEENNGEYTITEIQKWRSGVLVGVYSKGPRFQPIPIENYVSILPIRSKHALIIKYHGITKMIDVDADVWEKYHDKIGEGIPILVYEKYINEKLIKTEIDKIR